MSCCKPLALLGAAVGSIVGLVASPAQAQDVIYSQSVNGQYSRYEQYGYGRNAVVRYQGVETQPVTQGVFVQTNGNLQRVGTAPAFGTFYGTRVTSQGPSPRGLFQSLGRGRQIQGQTQYSLISQPYYQWTNNGYVLVQPQPYFVNARSTQPTQPPQQAQVPPPPAPGPPPPP